MSKDILESGRNQMDFFYAYKLAKGKAKEDKLRRVFDTIPDQFDKYRPRYSEELFAFFE